MPRLRSLLSIGISLSCERFDQIFPVEDHILANTGALLAQRSVSARRRLELTFGQSCLLSGAECNARTFHVESMVHAVVVSLLT